MVRAFVVEDLCPNYRRKDPANAKGLIRRHMDRQSGAQSLRPNQIQPIAKGCRKARTNPTAKGTAIGVLTAKLCAD